MSRLRAAVVGLCLAASVTQSLFFAWALVPHPEEEMYMYLGHLAITGRISLFQDELVGNRMPLPYYVIGLSQMLWPRSLLAARFFCGTLGLGCLILVWRIATRVGGELSGILALLLAVTQSLVIGYFDTASYHSLVSLLLLLALYFDLCTHLPFRRLAAMVLVSLLFFTRTTVMPVIPLALLYLLWQAQGPRERVALVAVTVLPPVIFFASDLNHLKFLAYVPVFDRTAALFGFRSNHGAAFVLDSTDPSPVRAAVLIFARWYRMWILAGVAVLAASVTGLVTRRAARRLISNSDVNVITFVVLYLAAWQFLIMGRWNVQLAVGYLPQFAILAAICLGYWAAVVVEDLAPRRWLQTAALLGLCAFFILAPAQSRPPMLPLRVSWQDPPVTAFYGLASEIGRVVPPGSRVFHVGGPLGLYTARIDPYLRQERDVASLALPAEEANLAKSGFWGQQDIKRWLSQDSDYAVVDPARVALYRGTPLEPNLALIDSLLAAHFTRIAVITRYPAFAYYVYRRTR